jgi:hypothetical protein
VALAACGVAHGAAAQGVMSARVTEARWDARLSVQPVALRVPGSALNAAPRHVFLSEMVFGSVGSLAGFIGGGAVGLLYYEAFEGDPFEDDFPGEMYVGGVAGSIVGTALGTHFGARLAGGRGGHFGRRLGGAALGLLAAGGAIELWHGAPTAINVAMIPLTQALVTALLSPRE